MTYWITTTTGTEIPPTRYEEEEEITIIIKRKKFRPSILPCPIWVQPCAFDSWDWEKHPVAHMVCFCPKCSPRY